MMGLGDRRSNYAYLDEIGAALWSNILMSSEFWSVHYFATATSVVGGLCIGIPIASLAGMGAALWLPVRAAHNVFIGFLFGMPKLILLPVAVLWFGYFGHAATWFVVATASFLPISISMRRGIDDTQLILVEMGAAFDGSKLQLLRKIALPSALSHLKLGLIVAGNAAIPLVIGTEIVYGGTGGGLGELEYLSMSVGDYPTGYALIVFIIIHNTLLYLLARVCSFAFTKTRLGRYSFTLPSQRQASGPHSS
jgi:ABC-type nitrate/sulfonate/bicarbonate transport system permease component